MDILSYMDNMYTSYIMK